MNVESRIHFLITASILCLGVFLPSETVTASEVRYSITDIGVLPNAGGSRATDLNDSGQVVGVSGGPWEMGQVLFGARRGESFR